MITSRTAWDLGSGPSAGAAWKTKDLAPDGEYSTMACPCPLGLSLPRSRPAHWGRRGWEQASLHFSHFFPDEGQDLRNGDSEAGTELWAASC